jgi:hypothetical protein
MSVPRLLALTVLLTAAAGHARAEEACFLALFGAERPGLNRPRYTHSFAAFVKVTGDACGARPHDSESFAISWLPANGVVRLHRLAPECGRNYGLHESLRLAFAQGERVSLLGPYAIDRELYDRACAQRAHLEGGAVRYKAVDTLYPSARVSNCIHTLSDLGQEPSCLRVARRGWGEPASYFIALRLRPWIHDPERTYPRVAEELGLSEYPIVWRGPDENPAGPLLRRAQSMCHYGLLRSALRH